jgi:hypothetical protein
LPAHVFFRLISRNPQPTQNVANSPAVAFLPALFAPFSGPFPASAVAVAGTIQLVLFHGLLRQRFGHSYLQFALNCLPFSGSFLNNGCLSCQLRKAALHGRGKRLAPANREAAEDLAGEEDSEIEEWR